MSYHDSQPLIALPRGWAEQAGVDASAELGPELAIEGYLDADLTDVDRLREVQALVPSGALTEHILSRLPALRVVSVRGTGAWDSVDIPAATRRGIAVCNVRDYAGDAVAEFTVGLIVALSRRILEADRSLRSGQWAPDAFTGEGLRGKTLGLIGCGSIGRRVAAIAQALGMEVFCATRSGTAPDGLAVVPLEVLLKSADIISLHLSLDDRTCGLLGRAHIAEMKPGVLLVNTARGALIDGDALLEGLQNGRIAGAALDVFDPEPLEEDHLLRALPNVILTPHIAAATTEAQRRAIRECLANIRHALAGRPRNLVNEEVLARWATPLSC